MSLPVLDLLAAAPADEGPRTGSDRTMVAVARVLDVTAGGTTVTVSLLGSAGITLPATASTWTGVATAHVLLDPDTGRPIHVLGPAPAPKTSPATFKPPAATTRTITCTAHPPGPEPTPPPAGAASAPPSSETPATSAKETPAPEP